MDEREKRRLTFGIEFTFLYIYIGFENDVHLFIYHTRELQESILFIYPNVDMYVRDTFPDEDHVDDGETLTDAHCQHVGKGFSRHHNVEPFPDVTL